MPYLRRSGIILFLLLTAPLAAHAFQSQDIFRVKGNKDTKVGKIIQFDTAKRSFTFEFKQGGTYQYQFDQIDPSDMYQMWKKQLKDDDVKDHLELAEFCYKNNLFSSAKDRYVHVAQKDPKLKADMDAKIKECENQEARIIFEEGIDLVKKDSIETLKAAVEKFKKLMVSFPNSEYASKAKEEDSKIQARIKFLNDEKAMADLKAKEKALKDQMEREQKVFLEKFDQIVKLVDDAKLDNRNALLSEAKHRMSDAVTYWKSASQRLLTAQENFRRLLDEVKDPRNIAAIKEKLKETDQTLVTVYRLTAGMYLSQGDHVQANQWVSLGLAVEPNDPQLNDLRVQIIKIKLVEQGKIPRDK